MFSIEPLHKRHDRKGFDCGEPALNVFLQQYATQMQKRFATQVYVALDEQQQVAGFYSLSVTQIQRDQSPEQLSQYSPFQPIPAALIGRLATNQQHQGQGVGRYLLAHALVTIRQAASLIGIAVVVVDAKNESVAEFYKRFGFVLLQPDSLRLFLLVSSLK